MERNDFQQGIKPAQGFASIARSNDPASMSKVEAI
ncbi:hypothetical protein ACVJF2_001471 [Bradyrhizobium sp. USDA 4519]